MARPKHNDPSLFTMAELSDATGISARNVQFLRDKRRGPFATKDQAGGLYGEDTLAELAMIAGCMGSGYPLSLSAELVTAFLDENPNHPAARFCMVDHFHPAIAVQGLSWFQRHVLLRQRRTNQPLGLSASHDQDCTLVVADREFVLAGTKGKPRLPHMPEPGLDENGPLPLGRMHGLVRGGEPYFLSFFEEYVTFEADANGDIKPSTSTNAARVAFQQAAKDAVALVTVNLSLSIRRAFERVYELRKAKGGPLWAEEGA